MDKPDIYQNHPDYLAKKKQHPPHAQKHGQMYLVVL